MPKNKFDSFIRFDRTPTCNSHRHRTTANTALAQRRAVKKINYIGHRQLKQERQKQGANWVAFSA